MQVLGIKILSYVKVSYEQKGRGGTGLDGIKWEPLKPETIKRKNARANPVREVTDAEGNKKKKRKPKKQKETTKTGKKRPSANSNQIGVDFGLQRASASPGFLGPDPNPDNPLGPDTGNVFEIKGVGVTVGFGRSYSEYFDDKRKLLPPIIPEDWMKACEELASEWLVKIIQRNIP